MLGVERDKKITIAISGEFYWDEFEGAKIFEF